jgi:transaldolase / glucose-6-phosphate isomerase
MSVSANVNERLAALTAAGTSVWLDQIRRGMIEQGELRRLIDEDSLRGVTANPAIFEKAILGSDDYDDQIAELGRAGLSALEIYDEVAIRDVQMAADVLRPVYDELGGHDGYVSLEVAPGLAHDTDGTLDQVRDYWRRVDRPNLLIKIPGTPEGVPAIEQATYEGVNVNITLLFAVDAYAEVAEAYIRGLERRRAEGLPLNVHSVASFFVSRVDTEADRRLEALGRGDLAGRAGVLNARAAYARFKRIFLGERFASLRDAGAPLQRPLWASTGVKNPHYPDTLYVDNLIAPHTVNTLPLPTLLAAADHARVDGATADVPEEQVERGLRELADAAVDLDDVTAKLLRDGLELFEQALAKLLAGIDSVRDAAVTGRPPAIKARIPQRYEQAIAARVARAGEERVARRIWARDATLWAPPGTPEIANRLGWLTIADQMLEGADELHAFARACREDGLQHVVLLGMGGSSLAPEVFRQSFGELPDALRLHVLDSTDAAAILAIEQHVELERTLFLVSTKSGGTIETVSLYRHFRARLDEAVGSDAGSRFVAITDPGSSLVDLARDGRFRNTFLNDPDIGGRYSALSYFGLVPAALAGVDVAALLERAEVAEQACTNYDHSERNAGLWLGCALGELALHGRDKLTFYVDEPIASFGLWVEQLIAESTGKQGTGIIPVAAEPVRPSGAYGDDRVFIHLRCGDGDYDQAIDELARAGHPTLTIEFDGAEDLGRIMFFAEFATAVAGWVLGINPFDQPNVQEAKDKTSAVLDEYAHVGRLPDVVDADDAALKSLLSSLEPPHYFAILAYVHPSDAFDEAIAELRDLIVGQTRATTTFGYGPRFQHSTGQLHKGGPPSGVFLQLVHDGDEDVDVPSAGYTFRTLKNAQATGDLETLRAHGLDAERVRLEGDPAAALRELTARVKGML